MTSKNNDLVQRLTDAVMVCVECNPQDLLAVYAELKAALRAALAVQGEAVAWVSPAGLQCLREGTGGASAVDGVGFAEVYSKQDYECDGTIPLYAHPTPDAGRVANDAELERIIDASAGEWHDDEFRITGSDLMHMLRAVSRLRGDAGRVAELEKELAEAAKCAFEYAAKAGELERQLAASREREGRMREALRHGRGIVPGGLWTSIELCAPNESPVKPSEYEDQYRFGWNACRAEVLRNMAALAAEKGEK